jgi:hypothetical protein
LLGYRYHETKVGAGEFVESVLTLGLAAIAYHLGEFYFFFDSYQLFASDLLQVFVERCTFAIGNRFGNLQLSHILSIVFKNCKFIK